MNILVNLLPLQKYADGDGDDKASDLDSEILSPTNALPFQPLLMNFLDTKAPTLGTVSGNDH